MACGAPTSETHEALSPTDFSSAVTAITSAFGDPTRRRIWLLAQASEEGVTAAEVAEAVELHPNVARHHLDKLAGAGHLQVNTHRSRSAGRPSKRYQVTSAEMSVGLPVRHDDLAIRLLARTLARLPAEEAEAVATEVGEEHGQLLAEALGDSSDARRSVRSAIAAVADALSAHGFAAHTDHRNDELRIVSEHCPFGKLPIDHPVICAVDRGMVRGMLGVLYGEATAAHEATVPRGDDVCVTTVEG